MKTIPESEVRALKGMTWHAATIRLLELMGYKVEATPPTPPAPVFKVGDRVERVKGTIGGMCEGDTGVVEMVRGNSITVLLDKNGKICDFNHRDNLRHTDKPAPKKGVYVKVGMRVQAMGISVTVAPRGTALGKPRPGMIEYWDNNGDAHRVINEFTYNGQPVLGYFDEQFGKYEP